MFVKTFVGKDRQAVRPDKRKPVRSTGLSVCRNCEDGLDSQGFCRKCTATFAHYRMVDAERFAAFQRSKGGRI